MSTNAAVKECVNKDTIRPGFEIHDCPNMRLLDGDTDMEREHYKCDVCGRVDWLDYEDMK